MLREIGFSGVYDTLSKLLYLRNEETGELRSTGFTFEDVTTYGLSGMFWKNNVIHFATVKTAKEALDFASKVTSGKHRHFEIIEQEKNTGPFKWTPQRMIEISDHDGVSIRLNAGEVANQLARGVGDLDRVASGLVNEIRRELAAKRASE